MAEGSGRAQLFTSWPQSRKRERERERIKERENERILVLGASSFFCSILASA
jgi:hypothetical protein